MGMLAPSPNARATAIVCIDIYVGSDQSPRQPRLVGAAPCIPGSSPGAISVQARGPRWYCQIAPEPGNAPAKTELVDLALRLTRIRIDPSRLSGAGRAVIHPRWPIQIACVSADLSTSQGRICGPKLLVQISCRKPATDVGHGTHLCWLANLKPKEDPVPDPFAPMPFSLEAMPAAS